MNTYMYTHTHTQKDMHRLSSTKEKQAISKALAGRDALAWCLLHHRWLDEYPNKPREHSHVRTYKLAQRTQYKWTNYKKGDDPKALGGKGELTRCVNCVSHYQWSSLAAFSCTVTITSEAHQWLLEAVISCLECVVLQVSQRNQLPEDAPTVRPAAWPGHYPEGSNWNRQNGSSGLVDISAIKSP